MPFSLDPQPGENELECARCGAYVYIDLTRCPKCGVNLYEPEEDLEADRSLDSGAFVYPRQSFFDRFVLFLRQRIGMPYRADEVFGDGLDQAILYNDLLRKVGGDREVVERLIQYESQSSPQAGRVVLLQNAIERWQRDNQVYGSEESLTE